MASYSLLSPVPMALRASDRDFSGVHIPLVSFNGLHTVPAIFATSQIADTAPRLNLQRKGTQCF